MDPFIGEIRLMSFTFAPKYWALCAGQVLPINQNQALFSLLGTTYGGDGRVTFRLPDLRGRALMHAGPSHPLGEVLGQEHVTLTRAQMPVHSHSVISGAGQADRTQVRDGFLATAPDAYDPGDGHNIALAAGSVTASGNSQPHANQQPYLALNYCIALIGIFPSRN